SPAATRTVPLTYDRSMDRAQIDRERLLLASQIRIEITDPRDKDAQRCLHAYFDELGRRLDTGYELARSLPVRDEEMMLPRGLFLLARLNDSPVGCGALKLHPDSPSAEVKRMWTSPEIRGLGLGHRLLARLEQEA